MKTDIIEGEYTEHKETARLTGPGAPKRHRLLYIITGLLMIAVCGTGYALHETRVELIKAEERLEEAQNEIEVFEQKVEKQKQTLDEKDQTIADLSQEVAKGEEQKDKLEQLEKEIEENSRKQSELVSNTISRDEYTHMENTKTMMLMGAMWKDKKVSVPITMMQDSTEDSYQQVLAQCGGESIILYYNYAGIGLNLKSGEEGMLYGRFREIQDGLIIIEVDYIDFS